MPEHALADVLKRRRQISITVVGRRTSRAITLPVWFVHDQSAAWLLPVYGSKTQWYRNLQADHAITIQVGKEQHELRARLIKDPPAVQKVVERFGEKYSPEQIKRWYTGLDVAVQVPFAVRSS